MRWSTYQGAGIVKASARGARSLYRERICSTGADMSILSRIGESNTDSHFTGDDLRDARRKPESRRQHRSPAATPPETAGFGLPFFPPIRLDGETGLGRVLR